MLDEKFGNPDEVVDFDGEENELDTDGKKRKVTSFVLMALLIMLFVLRKMTLMPVKT
ncbi:hypothetical protein [Seonamhaeicola sediminis]|uniref:hypothetical protein n=1 Tax=Seonamhaeicola sediminis TaxID=2528206 RepID=UPI0016463D36|nr:hypothetical protein [Seonamhaeicola sediminis]